MAVRRGRRAAAHGAGHTGVAEGGAAGDEDGPGHAETERTGTRGGGVAEGQHAAVDEGVVGVGIRAAEHGHTGAGHDQIGQLRGRREILDTRRDGQGRGGVVMDDEVAAGRAAARSDLEAARGRGVDGESVGTREKQAADAGAEGDVVGAEREGLAGGRGRDLQGPDRSRDRLRLRGGEEAVGGGRAGGGVRQADVRARGQAGEDERRRAADRREPVEVDAVGEDRASGADDALGYRNGGGGDLGVRRSGQKERTGVRAGAGAEVETGQVQAGDVRVAGDDGDDATVPIDGDRAERLRRGEAGTSAHREDGSSLQREGRITHQRGQGAAVGEIEQEGAALERGGAGVIAGDRRREGERAAAELGDVETVGGRGGERARESGAGVVATEGERGRGSAGGIQDEAGAAERADELAGVVEVESRAGGHGERAAVRQDVAGTGAQGALVDERGAAVAVVAGREQQDAGTGLDDVAARDERVGADVGRAGAGEGDVRLAGTQATGERDTTEGVGRSDGQVVVEIHQRGDFVQRARTGLGDRDRGGTHAVEHERTGAGGGTLEGERQDAGIGDDARLDQILVGTRGITDVQRRKRDVGVEIDRVRPTDVEGQVGDVADAIRNAGVARPIGGVDPGIGIGVGLRPGEVRGLGRLGDTDGEERRGDHQRGARKQGTRLRTFH